MRIHRGASQPIRPKAKAEVRKLQHLALSYHMLGDDLAKTSFTKNTPDPYLRCVDTEETRALMEEIHGGDCRNHSGRRSITHKIITLEYYWPNIRCEATEYVKKCPECQKFAPSSHRPTPNLHTLHSTWSFM